MKGQRYNSNTCFITIHHYHLYTSVAILVTGDFLNGILRCLNNIWQYLYGGFPGSSAGKESSYNEGDPGPIPGWGRSPREGIGYPLQYSWVSACGSKGKESAYNVGGPSLILYWEDPLEEGMATHSGIVVWRIPMDKGAWEPTVHGLAKTQTCLND